MPSNYQKLVDVYYSKLFEGGSFSSIIAARQFAAQILGEQVAPGTSSTKLVEECLEAGLVRAAKEILKGASTPEDGFDLLVDLYQRQPNLSTRSSTSVQQQAYSTPLPIAYLAATLAGVSPDKTVYEPTAGHGALILNSDPAKAIVNELNVERATDLRAQGYQTTEFDASTYLPQQQVDVVIANPPFGTVQVNGKTHSWLVRGGDSTESYSTSQIDHAIAFQSLKAMKDDGRAALILGAPMANKVANRESASTTYNNAQNRAFYYSLYQNYNVTQHFCVSGDLYARQGTSFPVDIIVINGRGRSSRRLPAADLPNVYRSFNELKELLPDVPTNQQSLGSSHQGFNSSSINSSAATPRPGTDHDVSELPGTAGDASQLDDSAREEDRSHQDDRTSNRAGVDLSNRDSSDQRTSAGMGGINHDVQPNLSGSADVSRSQRSSSGTQLTGIPSRGDRPEPGDSGVLTGNDVRGMAGIDGSNLHSVNTGDVIVNESTVDLQQAEIKQVPYKPQSQGIQIGTLVPVNMETAISGALARLEQQKGSLDDYVAEQLEIDSRDSLNRRFSAEQVDGLALAFSNLEKGESFIIGDQTGIGKGRCIAGVIKYAKLQGYTPIFVTQDPKLYGDMMRDLADIGVTDFRPFPTNTDLNLPLADGHRLKTSKQDHQQLMRHMMSSGELTGFDAIFTTYSQMQTVKGEETERQEFLREFAPRSILILDESHNAGGTATSRDSENLTRSEFVRELVQGSAGVVYSSATYAKNPYTMTLYSAKTGMRHAVENEDTLVDMIQRGGVPLQQMIAAKLTESGQYIRRERSYEGIEFAAKVVPVNQEIAENIATAMRRIMEFDQAKQGGVKAIDQDLKNEGKQVSRDNSTGGAGASSTNFTSIMHNAISQTLLALKAEAVVQETIQSLKQGEKPVISLANTMGSLIGREAEEQALKPGDPIRLSMGALLDRYLERSRDVLIKDYTGKQHRHRLSDAELGGKGVTLYEEAKELIQETDWSGIPVSPIDYIRYRLTQEGYRVNEITGREEQIEYGPNGEQVYQKRPGAERGVAGGIKHVNDFNAGRLDSLIINRSGSTGISLHASEKFADQSPRRMIIVQPELDINVFMQTLGRVHRTGQVVNPGFTLLMGDIPAEKRPAAVLLKKMASLNANTTADRESGFGLGDVTDFMNEYGDRVALEVMVNNPEIHAKLGYPIKSLNDDNEAGLDGIETEGLINKVTGRIPLLPLEEQDQLYTLISQEYNELLEGEKALGQNVLEAETLDLDAKTLARMEVLPAKSGLNSPFAAPVYIEVIDAKSARKPLTTIEVVNLTRLQEGMNPVDNLNEHDIPAVIEHSKERHAQLIQNSTQQTEIYRQSQTAYLKRELATDAEVPTEISHRISKLENRLQQQNESLKEVLSIFPVGQSVQVAKANGDIAYGVVQKIESRSGKGCNPVAASSWKLHLQVANSTKDLKIPLSKVNSDSQWSVRVEPRQKTYGDEDIYDLFDKQQSLSREQRQIFTGNVVRAYEKFKGKPVNFKDAQGNVRQGLLMSQGFDIRETLEKSPVKLPSVEDCNRFFSATNNRVSLKTADENLYVKPLNNGEIQLGAERSKQLGGRYYLNEELLKTAGDEFYSSGDQMILKVKVEKAVQVLECLYQNGTPLFAFDSREKARELLGITLPEFENLEQTTAALLENLPPYVEEPSSPGETAGVLASLERSLTTKLEDHSEGEELGESVSQQPIEAIQEEETASTHTVQQQAAEALQSTFLPQPTENQTIATNPETGLPNMIALSPEQEGHPEKRVAQLLQESGLSEAIMQGEDFHLRADNEPFIPLVIERHDDLLYLTHYLSQNGDTFIDCEMVFGILEGGQIELRETAVQDPIRGGEDRGGDRAFARVFSQNLLDQGFATAMQNAWAQQSQLSEPETVDPSPQSSTPASPEPQQAPRLTIAPWGEQDTWATEIVSEMLHKSGIVPELMEGDRFQLEIKNYPYPPLFLAREGETLSLSQHTGQGVETTLEQNVEFTIEAAGKLTLLEEKVFSININKDAQEMCADWSNQGYADGIKKTWEAEQQIEQFSLLDAAEQPVVEDSVEFEPAEVAIQAALDPEARNAVLGEVIEEEVPPTQVPLVINALTAEDQTVSEQAQLEPSTVASAPIAERTETERYSPTLEEMRNWRLDATLLGRNANYEKRIKQLGNEMLQGEQSQLPREQRDPAFQNPDFTLSEKAYQAMQSDSSESQQMRTPTRGDLIVWFQAAQLSNQDEVVTDHIKNLGRQMIQGTDQERLAPKDRDTHFKNPDFVLSRQDFVAMKAAIAPYQNSVEEGRENLRRPQLSI